MISVKPLAVVYIKEGIMEKNHYKNLLDALEVIHLENVAIMETLIRLSMDKKNAEEFIKMTSDNWKKTFKDLRKEYWNEGQKPE